MLESESVQVISIFVSSPGDVQKERHLLAEIVTRVNRTGGKDRGVRYELVQWENNVVPQIGPQLRHNIKAQTCKLLWLWINSKITPLFRNIENIP